LEKFVDYEWLHLDIAGTAFISAPDSTEARMQQGLAYAYYIISLNIEIMVI